MIEYAKDRDMAIVKAIETESVEPFKEFVAKYQALGYYPECFDLPSDNVLEISIRQMALHCTSIPTEIKGKAVEWLVNNNHKLDCFD